MEYIKRWQQCVKFGCWITANESLLAGWYHSGTTIGPDNKPTHTGATLHSLAVTSGKLMFYKLYAWTCGGASDGDIQS